MTEPTTTPMSQPRPEFLTPEPVSKKRKTRVRKPKEYKVHLSNSKVSSLMTVSRSGPEAAAADVTRTHIKTVKLNTPQKVWVRSHTKFHPYIVTRNYENPKLRKFTLEKDGDPISIKNGETELIPKELKEEPIVV